MSKSYVILFLALITISNCTLFTSPPALMPGHDVLKPGPEVQILKINLDGSILVSEDFMVWVKELRQEIRRLRSKVGEVWQEELN